MSWLEAAGFVVGVILFAAGVAWVLLALSDPGDGGAA